jgi:pyroglutamyl-peptidase
MPARPILVTGFRPFGGHPANPSERLARALAGPATPGAPIVAEVFDVSYRRISEQLSAALRRHGPRAVVCFGLDYGTDAVKLERLAVNLDDSPAADNDGEIRSGTRIAARGPAARWSTLPLDRLAAALTARGIPWRYSAHAGTFLCNHLLYLALGRAARGRFTAGFIHLPPTPELLRAADREHRTGMQWDDLLPAGRALVAAV